ncbi:MAG: FtsK/SpoIIIE domain-containing protein [Tepidisphaeraceae bacterium]
MPPDLMIEDLESSSTVIECRGGRVNWKDDIFGQFPLTLDTPPDEETLTKIVHKVGRAAKEASHVEVNFDTIAPKLTDFWTQSAASELAVPIGRMGATRLQYFRCGKGVAQHSLVAGKTGSGKSTLLHALITNLAMWYSPDEVEFYLIDFKKGVEFKTYADYGLPHARAIAVESDREFGLSVLQRIDAELARRGDMFRKAGVQDLASYRRSGDGQVLPRVMLIIDEFQEFFTEDDKLAQDAQLLLDRLVRQGRAFGVHIFLGSQTIGGSGGLARTTIGQMGIRIALQTSEADSQLILGESNSAARLLNRPGEAIYNDAGGAVESNSPFQVAWLNDSRREEFLQAVNDKLSADGTRRPVQRPLVFEGNQPADLTINPRLLAAIEKTGRSGPPLAWIGDPVAIKDPTSVAFRRQSGANLLIVGQADEQALGTLVASAISLATQLPKEKAKFVVLDGTPSDSPLSGVLAASLAPLPHEKEVVEYRDVEAAVGRLADEFAARQADPAAEHAAVFVLINGLQRYRNLRKGDDDSFSFSMSDEPKKPSAAKQLVELIREGPNVGIHVLTWFDTLASIERTFERSIMREFDNRVLFQMSANDSSNLIDSPAANKLGFFRALAYSEEQGVMEKFRPYGLPRREWMEEIAAKLV